MKRCISSYVIMLFIIAYHAICENVERENDFISCSMVNKSSVFYQDTTIVYGNQARRTNVAFNAGSPRKCWLERNQSLNIELERMSRVRYLGIYFKILNGVENMLRHVQLFGTRDESDNHTVKFTCALQGWGGKRDMIFACAGGGVWISSVQLLGVGPVQLLGKGEEPFDLDLRRKNLNSTWMYLIDVDSCRNLSVYGEADSSDCLPKTCRRPPSIENGQWHYLNESSYTKVQYSCREPFEMSYTRRSKYDGAGKGNGTATCNHATNNWEGVPACELKTNTVSIIPPPPVAVETTTEIESPYYFMIPVLPGVLGLGILILIVAIAIICVRKKQASVHAKVFESKQNPQPLYEEPLYSDVSIAIINSDYDTPDAAEAIQSYDDFIKYKFRQQQGDTDDDGYELPVIRRQLFDDVTKLRVNRQQQRNTPQPNRQRIDSKLIYETIE